MQNKESFTDHEWAHMHDAALHAIGKKLSREDLHKLFNSLPEDLQEEALEFGMNDTLWRDHLIEHLNEES